MEKSRILQSKVQRDFWIKFVKSMNDAGCDTALEVNIESMLVYKTVLEMPLDEKRRFLKRELGVKYDESRKFLLSRAESVLIVERKQFSFAVLGEPPYKKLSSRIRDEKLRLSADKYLPGQKHLELVMTTLILNRFMPIAEFIAEINAYIGPDMKNLCHLLPEVMDYLITEDGRRFNCIVPVVSSEPERTQIVLEYKISSRGIHEVDDHRGGFVLPIGTKFVILTDHLIEVMDYFDDKKR